VKAKIALCLSLVLAFSLFADGIEISTGLDDDAEEEASSTEAVLIPMRFKDAARQRSRRMTTTISALAERVGVRTENVFSGASIKNPSIFSLQQLYSLQQVYRL
jgi:hypothetical protein